MSREPTRHQISSKLSYNAKTPAFLQRLQRKIEGKTDEEDEEYEYDGSGRPPIPRRPPIPERPEGESGSADEDDEDEAPQIVVLKEGKHLTAREAEDERRKAKGLPPLPDPEEQSSDVGPSDTSVSSVAAQSSTKSHVEGLSFSSSSSTSRPPMRKRKIITSEDAQDDLEGPRKHIKTKKPKKAQKKLLSFGDGDS